MKKVWIVAIALIVPLILLLCSNNAVTIQWNPFADHQNNIKLFLDKEHIEYRCFDRDSFQVIRVKNCHPKMPTYDIVFLKGPARESTEFKLPVAVIQYYYESKKLANSLIVTPSKKDNQFVDEYFPFTVLNTDYSFLQRIQKYKTAIMSTYNDIHPSKKFVYRCYVVDNNPIEDNVVAPVTLESEIEKAILNDYELVSFINH